MLPEKIQSKIWDRTEAGDKAATLHAAGKSIVFTNGVFDILHAGHVSYLAETSRLADFVVVGINSDDSVKRLGKSPARPLQSELSRCAVVASLEWVNAVVVFNEDTPYEIISEIKPEVLVKGSDYKKEEIAGADVVLANGGRVLTVDLLPGYSTSSIEQKILKENS
jgi:rfaE bifunctional protein nucleotidyltransferase chain/domain